MLTYLLKLSEAGMIRSFWAGQTEVCIGWLSHQKLRIKNIINKLRPRDI
jgi:hypothetical protein